MSNTSNGLRVSLVSKKKRFKDAISVELTGIFENVGDKPFTLAFWWIRFIRVVDKNGKVVRPGPGPALPCGIAEDPTTLAPGDRFERREGLACTQPAGLNKKVGWDYDHLPPGKYRVSLIMQNPPAHGYDVHSDGEAWKGKLETEPIEIEIK
jgi:hypothetical protein